MQAWSGRENRAMPKWENRPNPQKIVRCQFGTKCDGSEVRYNPELLHRLSMMCNEDIKSRISYSKQILPLHDADLIAFIIAELAAVGLGANTFDEAALQVIARAVQGNLRLCRNLAQASLIAACLDHQRIVTVNHVNNAFLQPHWRSHEALIKQQVKPEPRRS
ncbi:hypothetical protein C7S18_16845 [Ahniella affigens]|uniref:Uncharacterized protein n=1 Tax=Ahniella affigens TaxID=2021234 RepID=A0A2P1PV81_9GAMM|nr:hypothetical protein [Ahniella affigens]AVP98753.1 hypothetical protein C7S18_16845 [Ahniella affigens]